jgi:hypothetical protein
MLLAVCSRALAGPPYTTDDPEPVDLHHWEVYVASQDAHDKSGWTGSAPQVEVNFGAVRDLQLHVIAPLAYALPKYGPRAYGYGDTELGIKYRFVQEGAWLPMIGTFPLVELPTGSKGEGLGSGDAQVFLPVWLQKTVGLWQTYGGVGVWVDLGTRERHWWYFGWQLQRHILEWLAVGAEVFHQTPEEHVGPGDTRFNLGAVVDLGETHHLLLSGGCRFEESSGYQGYFAYQLTFGPKER